MGLAQTALTQALINGINQDPDRNRGSVFGIGPAGEALAPLAASQTLGKLSLVTVANLNEVQAKVPQPSTAPRT